MSVRPFQAELQALGVVRQLSSNALVDIGEGDLGWIVLRGHLDIFFSVVTETGAPGARHYFLRAPTHSPVFCIRSEHLGLFIGASAPAGTILVSFTWVALRERFAAGDEWVVTLVDEWVELVGKRLSTRKPTLSVMHVAPPQRIITSEQPRIVSAPAGVVWAHQIHGSSSPLAQSTLPVLTPEHFFPLSRGLWIETAPYSDVEICSTAELVASRRLLAGLSVLHSIAQLLLLEERQNIAHAEQIRIERRRVSEAELFSRSLGRLSEPLRRAAFTAVSTSNCNHPVFLAFQAVAAHLKVSLKAPVEMRRGEHVPDPLMAIAKASSIRIRQVALKGEWWKENNGPLVGFLLADQRPIAILPQSLSAVACYDPLDGTLTPIDSDLAFRMGAIAYMAYRAFPRRRIDTITLLRFGLVGCRSELSIIAVTSLLAGLLALIIPYATGILFDRLIPGSERTQVIQLTLLLSVVAVGSTLFVLTRGFAVLRLQGKMDAVLQAAVWDRLLSLPVSFFRDYSSGDLAQRSMGISQIREILTGSVLSALLSGMFSFFSFALLFFYSIPLAVVASTFVFLACVFFIVVGLLQVHQGKEVLRLNGALSSKLLQLIRGIAKLRVTGTEARAFATWAESFSDQKTAAIRARRTANTLSVFNSVFPVLALASIFYVNTRIANGDGSYGLRTGDLLAFLAAFTQFMTAALTLSSTVLSVAGVVPIYDRAKPILHALPEVTEDKSSPGVLTGEVELNHVDFSYQSDSPLVLRDLNLRILPGQSVAFVGSSGCGKSTLLRLLLGFERPSAGAIYFDGQDLAGLDLQAVRRQIGVVLQTSRLMSGSIFENIAGSAPLSMDEVLDACRLAGLEEDIRRMPMGLHTNITDGGGGVSGGQRQRLLIARAIVKRPRLLLFDEATSALDNHTQGLVTRSLLSLQATRIIIAHRLSTVIDVDKIFVFEKGSVAESGTYAQLISKKGLFFELAERQLS